MKREKSLLKIMFYETIFNYWNWTMLMTMKPQSWIIIIDECIVDNIVEYE